MHNPCMEMLESKWREQKFVCVGLDPDYQKLTREMRRAGLVEDVLAQFVCSIVDDTKGGVCAFKPNIAFYEAYGAIGLQALKKIVQYIRVRASGVPIILDIKRGDIGNTNRGYVQSVVEHFDVDGLTLHPYLGMEANKPFLELNKMLFWLCRTSNPGAGEFQDLPVVSGEGKPARTLLEYNGIAKEGLS